jgi:nicotinate-nucleotide--dimethylbenzimidazole phosphoribosyltransferase
MGCDVVVSKTANEMAGILQMTQPNTRPFEDIKALVASIPVGSLEHAVSVEKKLNAATYGLQPLGHLETAVSWLAAWQGRETPSIDKPLVAVFVGTHGVAKKFVSGDLVETARERVKSISEGKAAVRGFAAAQNAAFKVYELGVEMPCADMSIEPTLSERDCAAAIAFGMEVVAEGADIIVLGSAGLGSVTAAAGIARGLYGGAADYWAGGQDKAAKLRIEAVDAAAALHVDYLDEPLEVLRRFGGRDIAGTVGAILAARHQKIPVLLDGFVSCAAAAVLHKLNENSLDHCLAAHITTEPAHGALLDRIEKKPLLDLGIGIGDGSGATLALSMIKTAAAGNVVL